MNGTCGQKEKLSKDTNSANARSVGDGCLSAKCKKRRKPITEVTDHSITITIHGAEHKYFVKKSEIPYIKKLFGEEKRDEALQALKEKSYYASISRVTILRR